MVSSTSGLFFRTLAEIKHFFPYGKNRIVSIARRTRRLQLSTKPVAGIVVIVMLSTLIKTKEDCMTKTEDFKPVTQVDHDSAVPDHNSTSPSHNILASGQCDLHCKIKETLLIRDLMSALNENVDSEKLFLYQ